MTTERKAERTARFNRSQEAKNKQRNKNYKKEKKEYKDDSENTGILRDSNRFRRINFSKRSDRQGARKT